MARGLIGISADEFWAMSLREWLATLDGWASQYPDDDGPPTDDELDALDDALTPEQKEWLGWDEQTLIRQKHGAAML